MINTCCVHGDEPAGSLILGSPATEEYSRAVTSGWGSDPAALPVLTSDFTSQGLNALTELTGPRSQGSCEDFFETMKFKVLGTGQGDNAPYVGLLHLSPQPTLSHPEP